RLAYFEAIAEAGSIRGAAQRLGLSVPVLSSALSDLEAELGLTLAIRSTRNLQLTSAGQEVYSKASNMLESAQGAIELSESDRLLTGSVGVTMAAELALHWLPKRLSRFQSQHPSVSLSIDANDRVVDLRSSHYDMAVRTEYQPKRPAIFSKREAVFDWLDVVLVARKPPKFKISADPYKMEVETTFFVGPGGNDWVTALHPDKEGPIMLLPSNIIRVANREAAIAFAKEGIGCALVTELSVRQDIAAGRLMRIFPDMTFGGITLRMVMRDNLPSAEAIALRTVLVEQIS
ncbi:MAG: LysR family transcriptional regulator, partial [Pseudomonadota bacterium]